MNGVRFHGYLSACFLALVELLLTLPQPYKNAIVSRKCTGSSKIGYYSAIFTVGTL